MVFDNSYLLINFLISTLFTWIACAGLSIYFLPYNKKLIIFVIIFGFLFGPITTVFLFVISKKYYRKYYIYNIKNIISIKLIFISSLIVSIFFTSCYLFFTKIFIYHDKILTIILLCLFIFIGILVGILISVSLNRIGFIEILCINMMSYWIILLLGNTIYIFSNINISPIFYFIFLLFSSLILILSLIFGSILGLLFYSEDKNNINFYYEAFIAKHFLFLQYGSNTISIIVLISIFAVMISTCGTIVVVSIMDGFSITFKEKILGMNSHLIIGKYGNKFIEYKDIIKKTKDLNGVISASPFVLSEVIVSSKGSFTGAILKGLDLTCDEQKNLLQSKLIDGNINWLNTPEDISKFLYSHFVILDRKLSKKFFYKSSTINYDDKCLYLPGIILGKELGIKLNVSIGDLIHVIIPTINKKINIISKVKSFRIAGFFSSNIYEYDTKFMYVLLKEGQKIFIQGDYVTGIEYIIVNVNKVKNIVKLIEKKVHGYPFYSIDWIQMNRDLFSALILEKIIMLIILIAFILMASLLISIALIIVILKKYKEISILKSIGASDISIMKIFIIYGLSIGSIGGFLGVCIGFFICLFINFFGVDLDPKVYYITELPVQINILEFLLIGFIAIIISFFSTIPPSLFAARLPPTEGLK